MPPLTDEQTRRNVIRQWILGFPRDTIAEQNNIGAGTVSSIVSNYKVGLDELDFDNVRQLAVEARQQGWNFADLASYARLYNFFRNLGAAEEDIESFITNINSRDVSPEKAVQYVNQLYNVSKEETIPLDQVPNYIEKKLEEKKRIDEQIKEADAVLQSKTVSIEAINEHIRLKEELKKYKLSTKDIHRLVNLLLAAKEYRYSPGKIVAKLRNIRRLENKEVKLKSSCDVLSKKEARYKDVIPFTEEIVAFGIGIEELIGLEIGIKEAAKVYNMSFYNSTLRLIDDIKSYNKINGLRRELDRLSLQKYALDQACSAQSQSLLKSYGVTEEQIISFNNFLESNRYTGTK
jgi:cell division septum initiation protein DivIVA